MLQGKICQTRNKGRTDAAQRIEKKKISDQGEDAGGRVKKQEPITLASCDMPRNHLTSVVITGRENVEAF